MPRLRALSQLAVVQMVYVGIRLLNAERETALPNVIQKQNAGNTVSKGSRYVL